MNKAPDQITFTLSSKKKTAARPSRWIGRIPRITRLMALAIRFDRLLAERIVTDYSDQQGSILIDRTVFMQNWNDDSVDLFRLYLKPGASESDVKKRILDEFGSNRRLFLRRERKRYLLLCLIHAVPFAAPECVFSRKLITTLPVPPW